MLPLTYNHLLLIPCDELLISLLLKNIKNKVKKPQQRIKYRKYCKTIIFGYQEIRSPDRYPQGTKDEVLILLKEVLLSDNLCHFHGDSFHNNYS